MGNYSCAVEGNLHVSCARGNAPSEAQDGQNVLTQSCSPRKENEAEVKGQLKSKENFIREV
jgi:hypothetical protein